MVALNWLNYPQGVQRVFWVLLIATALSACSPGFTAADIENMKESIKTEYNNKGGGVVREVVMLKESSTRATGFVKIWVPLVGEVTRPCQATMAEGGRFIWSCG